MAAAHYRLGNMGLAEECLSYAGRITLRSIPLYMARGVFHYLGGRYEEALLCFNETLKIDAAHQGGWLRRGLCEISSGRLEEAGATAEKLLLLDPCCREGFLLQAMIAEKRSEYRLEARYYARACALSGSGKREWFNLGLMLIVSGNHREARMAFEKALSYDRKFFDALIGIISAIGQEKKENGSIEELHAHEAWIYGERAKASDVTRYSELTRSAEDPAEYAGYLSLLEVLPMDFELALDTFFTVYEPVTPFDILRLDHTLD